uniref:Neural cell adhesion molecule L1 n=1 Tax=Acanthochromis polyacanthus TaxID=80966 RepID=A0A3Q1GG35_9TELE
FSMILCICLHFIVEQPPTIVTHTSGPIIALPFDNTITVRCEARGNPPPEYRWTKDGKEFNYSEFTTNKTHRKNGTFVLHSKQLSQFQGKYRCYASNKLGTAITEEVELIVPSIPKFPKETLEPVFVKEGEPIILECNPPKGVAPRQLYWMSLGLEHIEQDERVSMGTDGNLYFSNALQKDSRTDYCCFAAFHTIRTIVQKTAMAVVVESCRFTTEFVRKPSLLLPSGVQSLVVLLKGENLQLECIPGGLPTPNITWTKMGHDLPARTNLSNFQRLLTISAVDDRDQGKYMCLAENTAGKAVHYFDVVVEEPPMWQTEPPQSQLSVIGSDVHIKCSVSGKPPPDITWRRNGEIFRGDSGDRIQYSFHNAKPEDSAVYQCEASNVHGSVLANVNVMVANVAPLILTRDYAEYAVVLGVINTLRLSPRSKDETAIEGERFVALENGQSLKIISTEKGDSGVYMCGASNSEGKSSVMAVLDVKDPTKIVVAPQDVEIVSGTTAQLTCHAEHDKSLIKMTKNGENCASLAQHFVDGGRLHIMNVNLDDQGTYTCVAKTSLDEDHAAALLTVLDVPDAPKNLEISEIKSPRNVVLSWIPGSDHNSSVTEFVVEYEESQWEPGRWRELQKVAGNQATAELALHGHLNYQFRVYAVNAVGPGPPSEPTGRYPTPPAAPDRNPENIKIQGHLPHQMDISWEPLLPIEQNGPGLEYEVSYRRLGVEDQWTEHLVKRHSFVVRNTSTFIPYEIKIHSRNSHGWAPEPKVFTGYSGEDVPTAAPRDIAVEVINTTILRVSWTQVPPATVRGHLGGYHVSLSGAEVVSSLSIPGKRSHAIVPQLEPFSEYKLTVNVFNKKGNGPRSDPVTFSTPEGVPVQIPILTASNPKEDSTLLVWGPPLEANGILSGYLLQYQLINETTLEVVDSQEVNITGAETTQWQVLGLEGDSLYRFQLSACTQTGCGPPLAEESRTTITNKHAAHAGIYGFDFSTHGWVIGTLCAVALLTLVALMACFVRKNKGGKYAVKEKEDLHPDVESQPMTDDNYEYSDSDEKPLKGGSLCSLNRDDAVGDSISRDSMVDYADGGEEFDEDGSFIGEYSDRRRKASVSEPSGPSPVTA